VHPSPKATNPWYAALITTYLSGVAGAAVLTRRRGAVRPLSPGDIALLAAGTNKLARLATQEKVTAPLRSPFTDAVEEPDGSVAEKPARQGARRAVGELVTCPFCLSVWIATALTTVLLLAPRPTRIVLGALTAMAGSDLLQRVSGRLDAR
jgi:hypothetical protein